MSEDKAPYDVGPTLADVVTEVRAIGREVTLLNDELNNLERSVNNQAAPEPQHDKLFAALSQAQGQIQSAIADKENTHFNFKYADLDACWEACRKPLSENELAVIQLPTVGENGSVTMRTVLGHSSGQSISSVYTMHPDKTTPQGIASCMTYLRRYMLCAMVGISQEDDDATLASPDPDEYERISKTQVDEILVLAENLFAKSADSVVDRMLDKVFQIKSAKDIPANLFDEACNLLKNQHKRETEQAAKKAAEKKDPKPKADEK